MQKNYLVCRDSNRFADLAAGLNSKFAPASCLIALVAF